MADRRTLILDGALHVLAEHGMRGLTHRAVDTAAGIPQGSTSYYFRSRSALVAGCVQRLVELDLTTEGPLVAAVGRDGRGLVDVLVGAAVSLVTTQRHRTVARYELSLAATRDPQLLEELTRAGDTIRALVADVLRALGATDPARSAEELAATLDGLLFTALVRGPHEPSALAAALGPAIERAVRAQPGVALPPAIPRDVAQDTQES
jgi:DNA-binding transcriptional regulator YbjK